MDGVQLAIAVVSWTALTFFLGRCFGQLERDLAAWDRRHAIRAAEVKQPAEISTPADPK